MNWRRSDSPAARMAAWLAYGLLMLWPFLHTGTGTKGWIAELTWLAILYAALRFGRPFVKELGKIWGRGGDADETPQREGEAGQGPGRAG